MDVGEGGRGEGKDRRGWGEGEGRRDRRGNEGRVKID